MYPSRGYQGTDCGPCELQLQVIRFDSQYYCVTIHGGNGTDDAAGGDHVIPALQFLQHFLLPLFLPLHRHEQEKIKDLPEEEVQAYLAEHQDSLPKMPQEEFEKIHDETWEEYFTAMSQ